MSIIRWSPAIICTVVTTGLADYRSQYAHVCPHTLISVSGEDSRSLLRHLATLGTVVHWVTHSVGVSLRTHKAARGVSSLKTF